MNRGLYGRPRGQNGLAAGYTLLDTRTLGSTAPNIEFTDILGAYNSLMLMLLVRCDAAVTVANLLVQFNGDIGANYDWAVWAWNNVGGAGAGGQSAVTSIVLNQILTGASAPSDQPGFGVLYIPFYAQTTFRKGLTAQTNFAASDSVFTSADNHGKWRSTAAITSIKVLPASGNLVAGCEASLYGY